MRTWPPHRAQIDLVDPSAAGDDELSPEQIRAPYDEQFMATPYVLLSAAYQMDGTWIEPVGLFNFAIIDPQFSGGLKIWCGRTLLERASLDWGTARHHHRTQIATIARMARAALHTPGKPRL